MKHITNTLIPGTHNKPIVTDIFFTENNTPKPIVIFCHGYKGFKDWGAWNVMAEHFANAGFFFIKFNFSHNGGTVDQPIDFPDLDAFGANNYSIELDDLKDVIDWVTVNNSFKTEADIQNINLVGHSRGGGIVTIKAEEDPRITRLISLAGVSDYASRMSSGDALELWKTNGVEYVVNGRTKQDMPHYYQFFEDFKANEDRLTIKRAAQHLKIPHLIIHGDADTSVRIEEAYNLHEWNPNSELKIIKGANHVFETVHPWEKDTLSQELQEVIEGIITFLNK
ncbi:alpha/beta hydrolase family protein [Formosa algae]|uniref:Pimeloyl-ACP methyl ester carboxylesterase n=1 Tax=Formosa algae TaxID=225843 RepID=A0A9X0YP01_9FLAO|nr:alpha/beta hydrolase [Formosa algae]MBP1840486.1 pimeloyl-ACP methyl ester carboxylesterase [Formosa algae]MDQ0336978.1 pimeloyl-ACP methyl ester carboxylesterase [Formosa algae]OEI80860.1 alpha/beta hydrolase [Formosa algae]